MSGLSRRELMTLASAAVPGLAFAGSGLLAPARAASPGPALLHDPQLAEGQTFAARAAQLGASSTALCGDRVRQARQILARRPLALFGVSRASDELLFSDVAREHGYQPLVRIAHRAGCVLDSQCRPGAEAFAALARSSAGHWPQAFAELALGAVPLSAPETTREAAPTSSFSWVLRRGG